MGAVLHDRPSTAMKNVKLSEFTPDPRNANKGTERGKELLDRSIQDLGAGRSILVDRHDVTIAGNKTLSAARQAGIENAIVVETDGTRLVVVKRTDLDLSTDDKAKLLAVSDNYASEVGLEWDIGVLKELNQEVDLSGLFYPDDCSKLLGDLSDGSGDIVAISGINDTGVAYQNKYAIAVECEDEAHQEDVYNKLLGMGYKCKVLTL